MTLSIKQRAQLRAKGIWVRIEYGKEALNITPESVRELLEYNPATGIFIWRERGEHWFKSPGNQKAWNTRFAGRRAGSLYTDSKTGYQVRAIKIMHVRFSEHRLAWMWMKDDPVPPQIDHRNRDATDNRWSNLRASSRTENNRNKSKYRINTSGVSGVSWVKARKKWVARVRVNSALHFLGAFVELDEAAMEVMEFRAESGFDPGHGLEFAPHLKDVF